mgnify:CR=1 FL=1
MIPERPLVIPLAFLAAGSLAEYLLAIPFSRLIPVVLLVLLVFALLFRKQVLFSCLLAFFLDELGDGCPGSQAGQ